MRVLASWVVLVTCAACGQPTAPAPSTSAPVVIEHVDPARVMRTSTQLPAGYEVTDVVGRASPLAAWGFGPQWTSDPPQCGSLAEPTRAGARVRGWSASGPGGIVHAVVADATDGVADPAAPDSEPALDCASWTVVAGRTEGTVSAIPAPDIEHARTVGMAADTITTVEGGTQIHSRAITFNAYLGDHVASVTVVTDPGSDDPGLGPDFAATLIVNTVAALRAG